MKTMPYLWTAGPFISKCRTVVYGQYMEAEVQEKIDRGEWDLTTPVKINIWAKQVHPPQKPEELLERAEAYFPRHKNNQKGAAFVYVEWVLPTELS